MNTKYILTVMSGISHLDMGKWWHEKHKEMPEMRKYKELEGEAREKEVLSMQV